MEREVMAQLKAWLNTEDKQPLIITGAKGVGKTYLAQAFGREYCRAVAYIDFRDNDRMNNLFAGEVIIENILMGLELETGVLPDSDTLLIFDNIDCCLPALRSLELFCVTEHRYRVLALADRSAIGLLAVDGFPMEACIILEMYPLSLTEFMLATGDVKLCQLLEQRNYSLIAAFKTRFIQALRRYLYIGGMPEVVRTFAETHSFAEARSAQRRILDDISADLDADTTLTASFADKAKRVLAALPVILTAENKKFKYGEVRAGGSAREYEPCIDYFVGRALMTRVYRMTGDEVPLEAKADYRSFKLHFLDVGLLSAMLDIPQRTLLEGNSIICDNGAALCEQFIFQQLRLDPYAEICYWSRERAKAELSFVISTATDEVIPIEVMPTLNQKAKSMASYIGEYAPERAIRLSLMDYSERDGITNMPLYAINNIFE